MRALMVPFGNDSLLGVQTDVLVHITLALLIITGGLGFMVWFDLETKWEETRGAALSSLR